MELADAVFMVGTVLVGALIVAQILDWGSK
jgi:hypothetical protein